ncbi:hypothetical protein AMTRI_Chr05g64980 [Amborella trichopoda]
MEARNRSPQSFRAKYSSSLSTAMLSVAGLVFFSYNTYFAATRHSAKPEAVVERNSLKMATLGSIIAPTVAFSTCLWMSVPPPLTWVVWVACAITVLNAAGMGFLGRSVTESARTEDSSDGTR